jgi:hypothetical protein
MNKIYLYSYKVHLTTLPLTQTAYGRMVGWFVNNKSEFHSDLQVNYFPSFQTLSAIRHADSSARFVRASQPAVHQSPRTVQQFKKMTVFSNVYPWQTRLNNTILTSLVRTVKYTVLVWVCVLKWYTLYIQHVYIYIYICNINDKKAGERKQIWTCWISGSRGGDFEEYGLLGCDAV